MNQKSRPLMSAADGVRLHSAAFVLFVLAAMLTSISYLAETFRSPWPVACLSFGFGLGCAAACRRSMAFFITGRRRKNLLPFSAPASAEPTRAMDFHAPGIWQDIDANRDQRRLLLERMRGRPDPKPRTAAPTPRRRSMAHAADALESE